MFETQIDIDQRPLSVDQNNTKPTETVYSTERIDDRNNSDQTIQNKTTDSVSCYDIIDHIRRKYGKLPYPYGHIQTSTDPIPISSS